MSIKCVDILLFLVLASVAQAGELSVAQSIDRCNSERVHAAQRACLSREALRYNDAVLAAQAVVRKRITAWDEDAGYKARSLKLFSATTRQYQRYRSSQCEFDASAAAGGNGAGDMRLTCQIELDGAYLTDLQNQTSQF